MIFVTGASGFIGAALCEELFKLNTPVVTASRTCDSAERIVVGDVNGGPNWVAELRRCDTVVHLAARVHVMNDAAQDPLYEYRLINVQGTLNLARQAAAAGVRRFVFVSSIKVNGESTEVGRCFTEDDMPAPQDPYGISKMEAEQGLRQLAVETGLEVIIIRPPLVYGPGAKGNFATLLQQVVQRGWPLPLGAVHNRRSLVALHNLVHFIILCTTHPQASNQIFMVSDGHDLSTAELVQGLARAARVTPRLLPIPMWVLKGAAALLGKSDTAQRLCGNLQVDISKARRLLGWVPPISVDEGLRRAAAREWRW
jgi:nucleoside-diphosphate-sugar epimerase